MGPSPPRPGTTVVVSRLSVSDGHGWLTLHARHSTVTGYDVRIPAGDGSWSGMADVYLAEQDAHCLLQAGRPSPEDDLLPTGGYGVSIPGTRTGGVEGLTGSARALADPDDTYVDTLPVLDGSHSDGASATGLATGRYNLVLNLGFGDPQGRYSQVSLTESALPSDVQDTFPSVNG